MISPRAGWAAYHAASAGSRSRRTSSNRLVSSRATAAGRSPKALARSARVAASRCGASYQIRVADSPARSAARSVWNPASRAADRGGGNPSTRNGSGGRPDSTSAVTAAFGPGTTPTASPAAMAARTSR